MRPFTSTISLEEARQRLKTNVRPIDRVERVALADAAGRVAADDAQSTIDVPPFARSAMDGYAVIAADTASPLRPLRIVERIYTGRLPHVAIVPGTCAEIATGAALPAGADAVVMVEETKSAGDDQVAILKPVSAGQNVSRRGADIEAGHTVVRRGERLTPARVGALAAIGRSHADVYARPRVAILSTGNEIVEPGARLEPGQIFDVNRFTLSAIVAAHGGSPEPQASTGDDIDALGAALDACLAADVVIFSGGSSVGERDLVRDVVAARGEMIFHGIAIRPGKPTAFAMLSGKPFFGMPGNPTSCLSNAHVLLIPFLRATARLPPHLPRIVRAKLAKRIGAAAGRTQFYTVRVEKGIAIPAFKGSGDITSLSRADGYIQICADTVADADTLVDVTLFD